MMTIILATLLAATPPADRCAADISRAEASAFEATRTQHECMDPRECRVADELVVALQAAGWIGECKRDNVRSDMKGTLFVASFVL